MILSLDLAFLPWRGVTSLLVFLMLTSSLGAQEPGQRSARDVHVRIETDRTMYRPGDSIRVRLTLRNVSSHAVQFEGDVPRGHVRLRVMNAAGRPVEADWHIAQPLEGRQYLVTLKAGEAFTLRWLGSEWMNLRDWGYALQAPGRYVISGIPLVGGPKLTPDHKKVRSNEATFTIDR